MQAFMAALAEESNTLTAERDAARAEVAALQQMADGGDSSPPAAPAEAAAEQQENLAAVAAEAADLRLRLRNAEARHVADAVRLYSQKSPALTLALNPSEAAMRNAAGPGNA